MKENNNGLIFLLAGILIIVLVCIIAALYFDTVTATRQSLEDRVTWLEDKMIERIKPVIQINRATIYNTEGEIVIEGLDK